MSRRTLALAAAASLLFVSVVQAQGVKQQGATSTAATRAAVNAQWDKVIADVKAGSGASLVAWYTPDGVVVDPTMANITGKANIAKFVRDFMASTKFLDMTRQETSFEQYGDIAIAMGTYSQTFQENGKAAPTRADGRYTLILKNVDGKWLVHRDISTPMPPPPARK